MPKEKKMSGLNVVLVEPEIPPNTGNVARLCAAVRAKLHLVRPIGFFLDDKSMKRAGCDYWGSVELHIHDSLDALLTSAGSDARFWFYSTKGEKVYSNVSYNDGDYLVFGSETRGLAWATLERFRDKLLTIPMTGKVRSLNLSNSVAVVVYEALRQLGHPGYPPTDIS